jgi:hypothetical protein
LGLVVVFGLALSAWQLWVPNTQGFRTSQTEPAFWKFSGNRDKVLRGPQTLLPQSWYADDQFRDGSLPVLGTTAQFTFAAAQVKDDRLTGSVSLPPGLQPFATNIAGGPYLVHVGGGARVVGRTPEGYLVLERTTSGSQPVPVELRARLSAPVVLGRIATAASAALLLALAITAAVRRRRRRTAAHQSA